MLEKTKDFLGTDQSYRKTVRSGHRFLVYDDRQDHPLAERGAALAPSSVWRWLSWLGGLTRTSQKACQLIAEAAAEGAQLLLFPEAFIPAYPRGLSFGTVVGSRSPEGRLTWQRYWANAVEVPGPAMETLGEAAREAGVYLAMGVIERDSTFSGGTLFCTTLYFGPDGKLLGKHRKLKPTGSERLIWGEGDGSTLTGG